MLGNTCVQLILGSFRTEDLIEGKNFIVHSSHRLAQRIWRCVGGVYEDGLGVHDGYALVFLGPRWFRSDPDQDLSSESYYKFACKIEKSRFIIIY